MRTPDDEIYILKEAEFYAANVNAWVATQFERDKNLLTVSAGAIGLLITLISTVGVKSIESLILYVLALLSFLVCLSVVLWIFKRNGDHLQAVAAEKTTGRDALLGVLDKTAVLSFMIGVLLSSVIGCSTAVQSYIEKVDAMKNTKGPNITEIQDRKSIDNMDRMRPQDPAEKADGKPKSSQNDIYNLRPQAPSNIPASPKPEPTEKK